MAFHRMGRCCRALFGVLEHERVNDAATSSQARSAGAEDVSGRSPSTETESQCATQGALEGGRAGAATNTFKHDGWRTVADGARLARATNRHGVTAGREHLQCLRLGGRVSIRMDGCGAALRFLVYNDHQTKQPKRTERQIPLTRGRSMKSVLSASDSMALTRTDARPGLHKAVYVKRGTGGCGERRTSAFTRLSRLMTPRCSRR